MLYVFHLVDRHDAAELRARVRPEHKEYLGQVADRIAFAGPLLAEGGHTMIGSLLVIDFPDHKAALEWMRSEPFTMAGLYATAQVHAFKNLWPQKVGFPEA